MATTRTATITIAFALLFGFAMAGCESEDPVSLDGATATPQGEVQIDTTPADIDAPWFLLRPDLRLVEGEWNMLLTEMPEGQYQLMWGPVPGWKSPTPNPLQRQLVAGDEILFPGLYTEILETTGSIAVDTSPDGIDAPWKITGPSGFVFEHKGDYVLADREPGLYAIEYIDLPDYVASADQEASLEAGGRIDFGGTYVYQAPPSGGTIEIDVNPDALNAPWALNGPAGTQQGNGDVVLNDMPIGAYTLAFGSVDGWIAPNPSQLSRNLQDGSTEVLVGNYTVIGDPNPGDPAISGINGSPSNGASLSIAGTDFGGHTMQVSSSVGPAGWIEANASGTDFNALSGAPGWSVGDASGPGKPIITTQRAHTGSQSAVARVDGRQFSNWQSVMRYEHGTTFDRVYASFWIYWEPLEVSPYRHTQWKMFRINHTGYIEDHTGQFLMTSRYDSSGNYWNFQGVFNGVLYCSDYAWDYCFQDIVPEPYYPPYQNAKSNYGYLNKGGQLPYETTMPSPGQWNRVEMYLVRSDMNASNGSAAYWITKPDGTRLQIDNQLGWRSLVPDSSCRNTADPWRYFQFQNYFDDDGSNDAPMFTTERANFYYDDIYLQFGTQARVELGDVPTYEACRELAVQDLVSWSDGSVSIRLNQGSFQPGQTVYLFVIDERGVASQGHLVTLQ